MLFDHLKVLFPGHIILLLLIDALVPCAFLTRRCYFVCSVNDVFPQVTLNFAGSASMILGPKDYLVQQNSIVSLQARSCISCFYNF